DYESVGREFESLRAHHTSQFLRFASLSLDFACGLPLRSRPQYGSSSKLSGRTIQTKENKSIKGCLKSRTEMAFFIWCLFWCMFAQAVADSSMH
ncbi:MAG: hypothetical protein WAL75_23040, partial [Terracidiphilus sp.]